LASLGGVLRKPSTLFPKNKMKKNTPMKKLIHAIVTHLPFSSKNLFSANFLNPMMTKRLGMKKERPFPAKVAMTPKI
jgi:hypothetical protein